MKKITSICAGMLLLLGKAVFASEKHGTAALEHAVAAVSHIQEGNK